MNVFIRCEKSNYFQRVNIKKKKNWSDFFVFDYNFCRVVIWKLLWLSFIMFEHLNALPKISSHVFLFFRIPFLFPSALRILFRQLNHRVEVCTDRNFMLGLNHRRKNSARPSPYEKSTHEARSIIKIKISDRARTGP